MKSEARGTNQVKRDGGPPVRAVAGASERMPDENTIESVSITVGDQTFRVRVSPEEVERFKRGEAVANRAVNDVLTSGVVGGVRAYAMACYQLAMELEELRDVMRYSEESRNRLGRLIERIDRATEAANKK